MNKNKTPSVPLQMPSASAYDAFLDMIKVKTFLSSSHKIRLIKMLQWLTDSYKFLNLSSIILNSLVIFECYSTQIENFKSKFLIIPYLEKSHTRHSYNQICLLNNAFNA